MLIARSSAKLIPKTAAVVRTVSRPVYDFITSSSIVFAFRTAAPRRAPPGFSAFFLSFLSSDSRFLLRFWSGMRQCIAFQAIFRLCGKCDFHRLSMATRGSTSDRLRYLRLRMESKRKKKWRTSFAEASKEQIIRFYLLVSL